jgi:exonuclease III
MSPKSILVWNIRGLNRQFHRDALRELVAEECPSIMCVQETKLPIISDFDVI